MDRNTLIMDLKIRNKTAAGFTLIELLVVIGIIALLLSIAMPALSKAKEMGRSVVCKAHLRGIGGGLMNYTTMYDGWLAGPNTSGIKLNTYQQTEFNQNTIIRLRGL